MRFALIHVDCGLGPSRVSGYLANALGERGHECERRSLETLLPGWLTNVLFGTYERWCRSGSRSHGRLFSSSTGYQRIYFCLKAIDRLYMHHLMHDPKLWTVDCVVATSFYPAFFASRARLMGGHRFKIVGIPVDFVVSPGWRQPIDTLFVASQAAAKNHSAFVVPPTRVFATGIPLPHGGASSGEEARRGADVLISGGGWGLGPVCEVASSVLDLIDTRRVTVVCGNNRVLQERLLASLPQAASSGRLIVKGAVEDMSPYYRDAAVLVTKAGGVTLSEATRFGLPIVIMSALPGHEEGNMAAFVAADACVATDSPEEAAQAVAHLVHDDLARLTLVRNARQLVNDDSTRQTVDLILKGLTNVDA